MSNVQGASGNFMKPIDDIVTFLAPMANHRHSSKSRDYPWRRLAYDRTLTCPDLARVINDFLSADVDFIANEDLPARLCA